MIEHEPLYSINDINNSINYIKNRVKTELKDENIYNSIDVILTLFKTHLDAKKSKKVELTESE